MTDSEYSFLQSALLKVGKSLDEYDVHPHCAIEPLKDGGMGSIRFLNAPDTGLERRMGDTVVEGEFKDADGMPVSFAVDLDTNGRIFEIDLWRVDFESLQRLPSTPDKIVIRTNVGRRGK